MSKSTALSTEPLNHLSSQCPCNKRPFSLTISTMNSLEIVQKHSATLKETHPGVKKHKAKPNHQVELRHNVGKDMASKRQMKMKQSIRSNFLPSTKNKNNKPEKSDWGIPCEVSDPTPQNSRGA